MATNLSIPLSIRPSSSASSLGHSSIAPSPTGGADDPYQRAAARRGLFSRDRGAKEDDDEFDDGSAPLPFPSALPRSDFLVPDFDPVAYLSSLPERHQTLEDLRGELRDRSAAISAELLELVNCNYTAFLSLGGELRGGGDRVEDVKVALLAFRRQVEDVRARVRARGDETARVNSEMGEARSEIERGRKMMDLAEGLAGLEARLSLDADGAASAGNGSGGAGGTGFSDGDDSGEEGGGHGGEDEEEEEEEKDEPAGDGGGGDGDGDVSGLVGSSPAKLAGLVREYQKLDALAEEVGRGRPFVSGLEERLGRCRGTILLDLGAALGEMRKAGNIGGTARTLAYLQLYRTLDARGEAVAALKSS